LLVRCRIARPAFCLSLGNFCGVEIIGYSRFDRLCKRTGFSQFCLRLQERTGRNVSVLPTARVTATVSFVQPKRWV
jgi:hypothetical protein